MENPKEELTDWWKVWYNPEKSWFEVFDADGNPVSKLKSVTIKDDFDKRNERGMSGTPMEIEFSALCMVVKDMPQKRPID